MRTALRAILLRFRRWVVIPVLLGCTTTVVVAWAIASAPQAQVQWPGFLGGGWSGWITITEERIGVTAISADWVGIDFPEGEVHSQYGATRAPEWSWSFRDFDDVLWVKVKDTEGVGLEEFAFGWPKRALVRREFQIGQRGWSSPSFLDRGIPLTRRRWDGFTRTLPIRPLASGFLFNTLIYAAIWTVPIWVVPLIRRRLRVRGMRCTSCNYDLRGLANTSPVTCPECGHIPF